MDIDAGMIKLQQLLNWKPQIEARVSALEASGGGPAPVSVDNSEVTALKATVEHLGTEVESLKAVIARIESALQPTPNPPGT